MTAQASRSKRAALRRILGRAVGRVRYEHPILFLMALIVGVAAGYGAILFLEVINAAGTLAFGVHESGLVSRLVMLEWWHILLAPVAGGLVIGLAIHALMPRRRTEGVAEVIEAVALRDGRMDGRMMLVNAAINAASLGFGSSVGREGPVVHLGAALASVFSKRLKLSPAVLRTLVGCGVASAVAASFNAPIAGVIFALEVVVGHYAMHAFAPIVVAGVAGTIVSRVHLGDFPAFAIPDMAIVSFWEFPAFALLGICAAGVAVIFMRGTFLISDLRDRLGAPVWLQPAIAGLAVGAVATQLPEILGVGYEGTDAALKGQYTLSVLLLLLAAKVAVTAICLAFRFGTGIFSPALFIGAMTGGAFGHLAATGFPHLASAPGLYAIVGMGAVTAAVLGAPISTILIVFELTGDYEVTIAVMIAAALASMLSSSLYGQSFFLAQLKRRGLSLEQGKASHLLKSTGVRAVMTNDFATVGAATPLAKLRDHLIDQGGGKILVTDESGVLKGEVSLGDLPPEAFDPDAADRKTAADVLRANPPVAYADETLEQGLRLLERTGEKEIPVLSDEIGRLVVGMLDHEKLLEAYTRALLDSQGSLDRTPR